MNAPANSPSALPDLKLNYVEAGVDSMRHGKSFWDLLMGFGQANRLRIIAL
jgi:hypothetical protein